MEMIGIMDNENGFAKTLEKRLKKAACVPAKGRHAALVYLRRGEGEEEGLDLLILPPGLAEASLDGLSPRRLICDGLTRIEGCRAESIVTYGMRARDTVTCSSIDDGRALLSVQRELVTLSGERVEMQDIPCRIGRAGGKDAGELLPAVGAALLVLGVPPSALS